MAPARRFRSAGAVPRCTRTDRPPADRGARGAAHSRPSVHGADGGIALGDAAPATVRRAVRAVGLEPVARPHRPSRGSGLATPVRGPGPPQARAAGARPRPHVGLAERRSATARPRGGRGSRRDRQSGISWVGDLRRLGADRGGAWSAERPAASCGASRIEARGLVETGDSAPTRHHEGGDSRAAAQRGDASRRGSPSSPRPRLARTPSGGGVRRHLARRPAAEAQRPRASRVARRCRVAPGARSRGGPVPASAAGGGPRPPPPH